MRAGQGVRSRVAFGGLFRRGECPQIVVVGGGFGGIGVGVKLKRAGIHTFTIFEKSERAGGTWWDNQYPGAEVDVPSHMYCYSFKNYDWTRTHAKQAELHKYLEEVVDEYDLDPHIKFGTVVESARWDDETHTYSVRLQGGIDVKCHVLISAVGFLNVPQYPTWPGLDSFEGPKFHTSRWEHQHDLAGKTVAVVGTGSTATQIVPEIAPVARRVYLFQREPGWIMPKDERDFSPEERARFRSPWRRRVERLRHFYRLEKSVWGGAPYTPGTKVNRSREQLCRDFIDRELADHPDLRAAVTPTYPHGGKRTIFNSTFYAELKRDNVELVPRSVASVTPNGVVDADGVERPADVLVMATGFQPANYLAHLDVIGRNGKSIHEVWAGEPNAFLGITVPGFPNFFMLYGPGTNGGEIITMLERQAEYAVRVIKRMRREGVSAVEVKERWTSQYNRWLQSMFRGTSWTAANNYYKSPTGRIVTQWPRGPLLYGLLTKALGRISETASRKAR